MPPTSPPLSAKQTRIPPRIVHRSSTPKKACEQCRRRRRACNSQHPCAQCIEEKHDCVYSVVSDHSRSVFSTQAARRLSSGSACETCRRRKTKCDGGSPCGFCVNNNIECVNNAERRFQKKIPGETMDRIEDRLSRIERLMTAFTPSSSDEVNRHPRPHRHSVHGMVTQEQMDMRRAPYSSTRYGSLSPPPSTPAMIRRPSTHTAIAHSMLNLSISPSSSTTTNKPSPSASTPSTTSPSTTGTMNEWKTSETIPSLMDQLSKRTFANAAVDYTVTHYPIYPLTPPIGPSRQTSPTTTHL